MDNEEIQSLIKQLKAQGLEDEQIMDVFYKTFVKGEMDRKDLETLANAMGYELTDEFKNDKTPDPITEGGAEAGEGEITKDEAEAAKALEPGETAEEFKDKIEDMKDGDKPAESEPEHEAEEHEAEHEEGEDDEADWEKAQKMFRI